MRKVGRPRGGGFFVVFGPGWRHVYNVINTGSYALIEAQNGHVRPIAAHIEKQLKHEKLLPKICFLRGDVLLIKQQRGTL